MSAGGRRRRSFTVLLGKLLLRANNLRYTQCHNICYYVQCTLNKNGETSELYDNDKSYVSWRGDGQYFICSTIDSDTG